MLFSFVESKFAKVKSPPQRLSQLRTIPGNCGPRRRESAGPGPRRSGTGARRELQKVAAQRSYPLHAAPCTAGSHHPPAGHVQSRGRNRRRVSGPAGGGWRRGPRANPNLDQGGGLGREDLPPPPGTAEGKAEHNRLFEHLAAVRAALGEATPTQVSDTASR